MISSKEDQIKSVPKEVSQENLYYYEDNFEYFNHFDIKNIPDIKWKRPFEIIDDPCLLESYDSTIDGHFICGSQTPNWFPALVTLLKTKNLLHLVIKDIKRQDNFNNMTYIGMFQFYFFGNNKWNRIIIDDKLPFMMNDNTSLFCISSNKEEFLPSLLEKAYARYLGGYGKFQNISFIEGLMNFTGGIIEKQELRRHLTPLPYQEQKVLFKKIKSFSEDVLILCDTSEHQTSEPNTEEFRRNDMLPSNHFYVMTGFTSIPIQPNKNIIGTVLSSMLELKSHESIDMLRFQSPLLNGDWNGPYSIGSREWEAIQEKVRRHYDLIFNHECEFWITMEDFNKNMTNIVFCHIPCQSYVGNFFKSTVVWHNFNRHGTYLQTVPGGSIMSLENEFLKNDQYAIDLTNQNSVDFKLVLSMNSVDKMIRFDSGCGVLLLKVENNRYFRLNDINNSEIIKLKTLSETGSSYTISTTLSRGKYILLPWRKTIAEVEYCFRLYNTQKFITISLLKEDRPPFVQCLKCNLIGTVMRTKDIIVNLSLNKSRKFSNEACSSCLHINPDSAIRMTVVSAKDLERNNDKSFKNSYFIIRSQNYTYRSNTKVSTNNPTWNESFIFYRSKDQENDISVEVFAEQKIGFNKSLGIHYFSELEMAQEDVAAVLSIPVNKEWVNTSSKLIVKFKTYLATHFDTI